MKKIIFFLYETSLNVLINTFFDKIDNENKKIFAGKLKQIFSTEVHKILSKLDVTLVTYFALHGTIEI